MKKIIFISSLVVGGSLVGLLTYTTIRKALIRKHLDEAYKSPNSTDAVGGLDKLLVEGVFDKNAYNPSNNKSTISLLTAREKAHQIWDSYSAWFSSDQTSIVNAFNGLGHLDDVSKISREFYYLFEEDLLSILKKALSEKSKYNILIGMISKLPNN